MTGACTSEDEPTASRPFYCRVARVAARCDTCGEITLETEPIGLHDAFDSLKLAFRWSHAASAEPHLRRGRCAQRRRRARRCRHGRRRDAVEGGVVLAARRAQESLSSRRNRSRGRRRRDSRSGRIAEDEAVRWLHWRSANGAQRRSTRARATAEGRAPGAPRVHTPARARRAGGGGLLIGHASFPECGAAPSADRAIECRGHARTRSPSPTAPLSERRLNHVAGARLAAISAFPTSSFTTARIEPQDGSGAESLRRREASLRRARDEPAAAATATAVQRVPAGARTDGARRGEPPVQRAALRLRFSNTHTQDFAAASARSSRSVTGSSEARSPRSTAVNRASYSSGSHHGGRRSLSRPTE